MGTLLGGKALFLVPACFYQPITYATEWASIRDTEKSVDGHPVALCLAAHPGPPSFHDLKAWPRVLSKISASFYLPCSGL